MSLALISGYSSDSLDDDDIILDTKHDEHQDVSQIVFDLVNSMLNKIEKRFLQKYKFQNNSYRCKNLIDMDLSDSDDEDDQYDNKMLLSDWSLSDSENSDNEHTHRKTVPQCATKGEFRIDDLPPIENLHISVETRYLAQLGIVSAIVNQLIIIQSFKNIPALDIDTVLFWKDGSSFGQIFDVIGPVVQPNYVLRFNSNEQIKELKIEINCPVYYAESYQQPITNYVFVANLQKEKGTDASWEDNNEPPPECVDYSDDETERSEKWKRNAKGRKRHMNKGSND